MAPVDLAAQRRQRRRNRAQAILLLAGMGGVLALCAWLLAGGGGLLIVVAGTVVALATRPRVPPEWVLRAYGAHPLPPAAAPELHRLVGALAARAELPARPRIAYVPSRAMNAFAVGRPHDAAIAVTDGLLRGLPGRELVGVLAHEVSHVRADDLWIMTLADTLGRLAHALAYAGLALLVVGLPLWGAGAEARAVLLVAVALTLVPTAVTLLQLALSRSREYDADVEAARLTGDPEGLAAALHRLERAEGRIWERILVPRRRGPDPLLLRTHPPTEERVRRLRSLSLPRRRVIPVRDVPHPPAGYAPVRRPVRLRRPGVWW